MGKRSSFERRKADFYPTPRTAVLPLIPHLRGIRTFAEPCAGDGDLVRNLESFGLRCVYAGDIRTGQGALAIDSHGACDSIITNPPYDTDNHRRLMHAMILHFQRIAPTWLLLHFDWASNEHAAPYLGCCSDIVVLPRVKWFKGTGGKENHAWYRFDSRHTSGPVLHNNRSRRGRSEVIPSRRTRICEQCGKRYEQWQRSSSRFCSAAHRQQAYRQRLSVTPSVTATPSPGTAIEQKDSFELFRYVLCADVPRLEAEGWEPLPALDGTHHGHYSVLMRRVAR